ncbi:MAG: permease [Thermomicrobiales bacterium]
MQPFAPPAPIAPPTAPMMPAARPARSPRKRDDRPVMIALVIVDAILALALIAIGGRPGIQTFSTVFLGIFIAAMPFVLLGALVSGVIGVFVRDETVARLLPHGRLTAPVAGSLLGLIFPVCECGVVPVTRRLVNKGAPVGLGVAFLLASPVINPIVIWSTYAAFGGDWSMVAWRAGLTFAIAVLIGVVFAFHPDGRALLKPAPTALGYHPMPLDATMHGDDAGQGTSPPAPLHCDGEGCLASSAVANHKNASSPHLLPLSIAMERGAGG